ncbi:MAG TPA: DUF58 domain-containing protein [candidate division Zixibacteria bacterium]|nr:DUF58 domain-containing protein [candidate division Zixibacteria bacterium]MDD4918055.1 DUF58 domain-containing protein [candidate division Zixibacteria bacterium]MDM7971989.1 DUF58 domain-containing protein [candidate division Zixibacteria bacterium]HOZ08269.1 DUF58 domain-containing protein [candidate division Zixibacteria bacterium]HPC10892.1 DUF58 domain-containing protein [candidate division Zixibacteria bacterium]
MLPSEILKKIRRIEIRTKRLVNDLFSGEYHSTFKGQGMEFEEVRQYEPGDDIRLIDWNVTARTGYPHIKKFREERELSVVLLVDASSSGRFGTRERFKSETAAELGALLAFSAIKNNDKVGLIIFTDQIEKFVPPRKGRGHVLRLIREILFFEPKRTGTDVAGALEYLNRVVRRKSVVFLISDFLSEDFHRPLQVANRRHDLIAVKISDPRESRFDDVGLIELEDAETGEVYVIDTGSKEFRREYAARADEDLGRLEREFRLINLDFINIRTDQPYIKPLIAFFRSRERRL